MKLNLISGTKADDIREDYFSIQGNDNIKTMLKAFDKRRDRLASLFVQMSDIMPRSCAFRKFANIIMVLFHGNASVERGFSQNKHCPNDNLLEESLVARRMICEHVTIAGGVSTSEALLLKNLVLSTLLGSF